MSYLLLTAFVALAVVTGLLYVALRRQQRLFARTLARRGEENLEPEMVLTLRVRDPLVLAKRESRSARMVADRLPVMVTRMVYQQVQEELALELKERDIDVDLQIEYR
ncbi:MAG: hypothetical protein MI794_04400 [Pseudomonadales bacterium]|nr:hypothetical protein [Pseudomonadales bacterium]